MSSQLLSFSTLVAAVGCGLIGGVFFAFSNFVMKALQRLPAPQGIAAMQSINVVVLNPWFLGVFVGTAALCLGVGTFAVMNGSRPGAAWLLAGALLYLAGNVVVTRACNIPRNDALAVVEPTSVEAAKVWADYLVTWTAWNHVRTIAALAAAVCLIVGR